jgi:peptidoglycan-associated lipoprotein
MKLVSKPITLLVASAALVLAGCSKKPERPIPTQTAPMGSTTAGLAPTDLSTTLDANSGLTQRPDDFDPNGLNRALLSANSVYFDFDESSIKAGEREKLKAAKDTLDKNPTYRLVLEGHCDWRGTAEYNLGLGDRRAGAVKKYLLSIGVAADKLETLSKGSLEATKNADDATRAKDRRVDLVVSRTK